MRRQSFACAVLLAAGCVGLLAGGRAIAQKVRVGDPIFELVVVAPPLVRSLFPLSESSTAECVDDAIEGAMAQARAVVEAAAVR